MSRRDRREFFDAAHDSLHGLAAEVAERDRPRAARVLEAKQAVERSLAEGHRRWPRTSIASSLPPPTPVPAAPGAMAGCTTSKFSPDGRRAYAASENNYRIYNTTDPADPVPFSRTPNVGSYAHGVFPDSDRDLMVTNDESLVLGGFLIAHRRVPRRGPRLLRHRRRQRAAADRAARRLRAERRRARRRQAVHFHFGRFARGTKIMSIGWYIAGSRVVDWSNPSSPVEVAGAVMAGTNAWAAKFYEAPYLCAGDLGRGFDVFRWSGDGPAPWVAEADLAMTKTGSASKLKAGEPLAYTIEVTNGGPDEASGVVVHDRLPAGAAFKGASTPQGSCTESGGDVTCTLGRLADGPAPR